MIEVPIQIASHTINAILDTGSIRNIISTACINKLKLKPTKLKENVRLRVVNGKCVVPTEEVSFQIKIDFQSYFVTAVVVPNFTYDLLLGIKFMHAAAVCIDFAAQQVSIGSHVQPLPPHFSNEKTKPLFTAKDIVIKPRSEKIVQLKGNLLSDMLLIEPVTAAYHRYGIQVARTLSTASDGSVFVRVANLSGRRIALPSNAKIAEAFDIIDINEPPEPSFQVAEQFDDGDYLPCQPSDEAIKSESEVINELDINTQLSQSDIAKLRRLMWTYTDVMSKGDLDIGRTDLVEHHIDTEAADPIRLPPYRKSFKEREELIKLVRKLKGQEIIRDSVSPWASPVVLVRKRDGSWRFCVDWRKLNKVTKKDSTPLPRIDDTLDRLSGAKFFTKIDLTSGYYQVELDEESKEKTAFETPDGHYEFNRLGMGLCNAPATFQRLMYKVLGNLMWTHSMAYLDDIVIFSKTFEEHIVHLEQVFEKLREAGLKVKPKKCSIAHRRLQYLGHIVDADGVRPDPANVEALTNYPQPKNVKQIQQFLGICGYYRRFINDFASLAKPLTALIHKNAKWEWSSQCTDSFIKLRSYLLQYPLLRHPDFSKPFMIYTDASAFGIGAILKQLDDKGKEVVVSYASRTLSRPEQNYSATERECLAIIFAVKKFRPYLYGTKFTVVTDHCSLCWLMKISQPNGRLTRWSLCLQDFEYEVIYKNGRKHLDADALSRNPTGLCPAPENALAISEGKIQCIADDQEVDEAPLLVMTVEEVTSMRALQLQDNWSKELINCIEAPQVSHPRNLRRAARCYEVKDGLLHRKLWTDQGKKLVICLPKEHRKDALDTFHDCPTGGHLGIRKTWSKIRHRYFWPKIHAQVINYVQSCHACNSRKTDTQQPVGKLQPLPPVYHPFERVGLDKLGPLPESIDGNKYIFVVTDYCTRTVIVKATPNGTAVEAAKFFLHDVILRYTAPKEIITDRGTEFINELFKSVTDFWSAKHRKTTAYHPRTNGLTERFNKILADMMSHYVSDDHKDWDRYLPFLVHAYNTSTHDTLGYSPAELLFGFSPDEITDVALETPGNLPDPKKTPLFDIIMYRQKAREIAAQRLTKSQESSAARFDKGKRQTEETYKVGDLMWVKFPRRPSDGQAKKLKYQYTGPYELQCQTAANDFQIVDALSKTEVVNADRFKKYYTRNDEAIDPLPQPTEELIEENPIPPSPRLIPFEPEIPEANISSLFDQPEPEVEAEQLLQPIITTRSGRQSKKPDLNYDYINKSRSRW